MDEGVKKRSGDRDEVLAVLSRHPFSHFPGIESAIDYEPSFAPVTETQIGTESAIGCVTFPSIVTCDPQIVSAIDP